MTEKIKKILSVIVICSLLFMQTTPFVSAEESTPPTETTTTNTNPEQVSTDTDSSNSSTQDVDQNTQTQQSEKQDGDGDDEDMDLDGDEDHDFDADAQDNAARAYREQLRAQIEQQVQQSIADQQQQPQNGDGAGVGDVEIETGDATNTAGVLTTGNNNLTADGGSGVPGASVVNSDNGTGSSNDGSVSIVNNGTTIQDNNAAINNSLHQDTTTGSNAADDNVGDAAIETGDANTSGTIVTAVNTNVDGVAVSEFNINDDHIGDIILDFAANCIAGCSSGSLLAQNTDNGSESVNDASLDLQNNNSTFQNNDAAIGNDMYLTADSGNNSASRNIGGDTQISTGDANIAADVLTFANNNIAGNVVFGVVNIFGDLIGDILFDEEQLAAMGINCTTGCTPTDVTANNTGNGSDSTNNADVTVANNNDTFQSNDADITNNLVFDATTGDNHTNANTGGDSSIDTGNTSIEANVLNIVNSNIVGGNMWLVLINQAGNWIGKIIGAPQGQNFAGSDGTQFAVDENGFITATNNGNGANSDNNASVSQENNNTTVQNNKANIVNNLYLDANTGGNNANDNTGGNAKIKTGDAQVIANLVNFVNNNIAGNGKLFVTVVNVFGSWMGDFVAPGQEKQNNTQNQQANGNGQNNTGSPGTDSQNNDNNDENNNTGSSTVTNNSSSKKSNSSSSHSSSDTDQEIDTNGNGTVTLTTTGNGGSVLAANATATPKVLKINLAWLVLSLPLIALGILGKKLFLARILPRK